MLPYTKEDDSEQSASFLLHPPPAEGVQERNGPKMGDRRKQAVVSSANQSASERALGLALTMSAAVPPYLTRQLATASPRDWVTPYIQPGKVYVPPYKSASPHVLWKSYMLRSEVDV